MTRGWLVVLLWLGPASAIQAQWIEQTIELQAGWNMVWLDVSPDPCDVESVLGGLDYESIWTYMPSQNPSAAGQWFSHHKAQPAFVSTLSCVQSQRGYLVNMRGAATLRLTGQIFNRSIQFEGERHNLFGASVAADQAPTFDRYFSHPNAQGKVSSIFQWLGANPVALPLSSPIDPNQAYWVHTVQGFLSAGPLEVNAPLEGYQFGTEVHRFEVVVEVAARPSEQTVHITAVPSTPPQGAPSDAGNGDVSWVEGRVSSGEWTPLSSGMTVTIPPETAQVQLEIRAARHGRDPAMEAETGSTYQAVIAFTTDEGYRRAIGATMEVRPDFGLWIGQARLTQVSTITHAATPNEPELVGAESLTMALILANPTPAGARPAQLLNELFVDVDRDGRKLRYRYNAILFHEPVDLDGTVETEGTVTGRIVLPEDHPLNPYRHRYHPEHRVGYPITRDISMTFTAADPDPLNEALGLNDTAIDNELQGVYREVISGVALEPITVQGWFRLHRLSETTELQPADE